MIVSKLSLWLVDLNPTYKTGIFFREVLLLWTDSSVSKTESSVSKMSVNYFKGIFKGTINMTSEVNQALGHLCAHIY